VADQVLTILSRLRRRIVALRTAEAAAFGATVAALVCVFVMAGWVLAGRYALAAAAVCAVPLLGGLAVAASRRLRGRLAAEALLRWYGAALPAGIGAAAVACTLTGAYARLPKNAIILLIPASAAVAAALTLLRRPSLRAVAASVDQTARLRERLSTAWELSEAGDDSAFSQAVRSQAEAAAGPRDLRRVSFWQRTSATVAALGLSIVAAALMLPWQPLRPPDAALEQRWQQVGGRAGASLQEQLAALEREGIADRAEIAPTIARLRELAGRLRSARPTDARQWSGQVVELEQLTRAVRRAVDSGQLEPAAARRLAELTDALDQLAAEIAEDMGGQVEYAASADSQAPPPPQPSSRPAVPGYATVYNPDYAALARPATTDTAPGADADEQPAIAAVRQVPFEQAWAAARRRAAEAISRRDVPAEYRQLVADFFAAER